MAIALPRRARISLAGAAASLVLLVITWYLSHHVGFARRVDNSILLGFAQLNRPRLDQVTNFVANLCDPQWYVFLALIPVGMALARRRYRVAVMLALVLLGANETTQLLKPVLGSTAGQPGWWPIGEGTWPSGHATASMTLALCTVIAAPPRRRPAVAAAMVAFALAVCYSFLELEWHYPSDVFGGFLVAATWTLLGVAGLSIYEARRRRPESASEAATAVGTGASRFSIGEALTPMVALLAVAAVCIGLVLLARPAAVISYARGHELFVVGAAAIAALGLVLASGLTLMLRRG